MPVLRFTSILILFVALSLVSCGVSGSTSSPFNGERAYADVEAIVAMGARVPGKAASKNAQEYIRAGLTAAGLQVREHEFKASTPYGVIRMKSMIGIVKGSSDKILMLGNHYDTKYFRNIEFVGANDGGSTTGWMLEMARVLGSKREGHTIWLCFFDGEEAFKEWTDTDSLYGSREMVAMMRESGELEKLNAMINVDMIGDCDLGVFQDTNAPAWLLNLLWSTADESGHGDSFLPWGNAIDDDHLPFRRAGIDAINLIDFRFGGDQGTHDRTWHTVNDTMDKVCAESMKIVGDVVYHALPKLDAHFGL